MKKAILHIVLLPLLFAALASCSSSSRLDGPKWWSNPDVPGGGGGNGPTPPGNGDKVVVKFEVVAIPSSNIAAAWTKVNLQRLGKKYRTTHKKNPVNETERAALTETSFKAFEQSQPFCDKRMVGDAIIRHRPGSPFIDNLQGMTEEDFFVEKNLLNSPENSEWHYSLVRMRNISKDYREFCRGTDENLPMVMDLHDEQHRERIQQLKQREREKLLKMQRVLTQYENEGNEPAGNQVFPNYVRDWPRDVKRMDNGSGTSSAPAAPANVTATDELHPNDEKYEKYQKWHHSAVNAPYVWQKYWANKFGELEDASDKAKWLNHNSTEFEKNIIVAVIDTGVYVDHPDFGVTTDSSGLLNFNKSVFRSGLGYDFISASDVEGDEHYPEGIRSHPLFGHDRSGIDGNPFDNGDQQDEYSAASFHGTHVAGTIAAVLNNSIDVAGVALNVLIMPVRVLGVGGGSDLDVSRAILWAAGLYKNNQVQPPKLNGNTVKADIISLSLGGPGDSGLIREAVARAHNTGVTVIAAAGNEGWSVPSYPASYPEVIGVGAITLSGRNSTPYELAFYSNTGSNVDILAPGGDTVQNNDNLGRDDGIYSTAATIVRSGGTRQYEPRIFGYNGTSMACPHVSAAAAMLKGLLPTMDNETLRALLFGTANTEIFANEYDGQLHGYGLLDMRAAYDQLQVSINHPSLKVKVVFKSSTGETITQEPFGPELSKEFSLKQGQWTVEASLDVDGDGNFNDGSGSNNFTLPMAEAKAIEIKLE